MIYLDLLHLFNVSLWVPLTDTAVMYSIITSEGALTHFMTLTGHNS